MRGRVRRRPASERYTGLWQQGSTNRAQERRGGRAHRRRGDAAPTRVVESVERSRSSSSRRSSTTSRRCSARRTSASASPPSARSRAAQALYDQHKVLTYPRTNSRYLSSATSSGRCSRSPRTSAPPPRSTRGCRATSPASTLLPPGASSTTPRSPTTTRSSPPTSGTTSRALSSDEQRVYDMVARRFLAVFHPPAAFERTSSTAVGERAVPLARQGADRRRLARASTARTALPDDAREPRRRGGRAARCPSSTEGQAVTAPRPRRSPSRRSRRRATPSRRCCARWRRRASSSRTTRQPRP